MCQNKAPPKSSELRSALTNSLPQVEFLEFLVAIQTYLCVFYCIFSYVTLAGGVARSKVPAQKFALRFHIMKSLDAHDM
jgi:hypothetical protein